MKKRISIKSIEEEVADRELRYGALGKILNEEGLDETSFKEMLDEADEEYEEGADGDEDDAWGLEDYEDCMDIDDLVPKDRRSKKALRKHKTMTLLTAYLIDVDRIPRMTDEEIRVAIKEHGEEGANEVVKSHLRLVLFLVNKLVPPEMKGVNVYMELIQEGNLGLMAAAKNYDPDRGTQFITYAYPWVKTYIRKGIENMRCGQIKKPPHVRAAFATIAKIEERLIGELGREITDAEICMALESVFSKKKMEEIMQVRMMAELSLDEQIADGDGDTLAEIISGDDGNEEIDNYLLEKTVGKCMQESLTEKQRLVLSARFGLGEFKGHAMTLRETAELLSKRGMAAEGVSTEWIYRIESDAKKALRKNQLMESLAESV